MTKISIYWTESLDIRRNLCILEIISGYWTKSLFIGQNLCILDKISVYWTKSLNIGQNLCKLDKISEYWTKSLYIGQNLWILDKISVNWTESLDILNKISPESQDIGQDGSLDRIKNSLDINKFSGYWYKKSEYWTESLDIKQNVIKSTWYWTWSLDIGQDIWILDRISWYWTGYLDIGLDLLILDRISCYWTGYLYIGQDLLLLDRISVYWTGSLDILDRILDIGQKLNPIPVGLFLSNIGWGPPLPPMVSRDIMHNQCCNSHVYRPTFWAQSNGKGFESLRPLHVSCLKARHGAPPT